jgi:TolB-like protein/cytochrome c-type biogenesis protein CcmH/NrfG
MDLFREIKRRKVLHTLSFYVVGCWVVLQVVEVLSGAGLPPSTMRVVLAAMSVGFPLVLVIAWFFDISSEGVTRTLPRTDGEELPMLNLGDHALFVGLLAILALNTYVLSSPAPISTVSGPVIEQRTLAVLAFDDIDPDTDDDSIGDAIAGELRSELTRFSGLRVLGPETSRVIKAAGDEYAMAAELGVTSILTGDTQLKDGKLTLQARLLALPAGNVVWQSEFEDMTSRAVELQKSVTQAVLEIIFPSASAATAHAPRIEAGECSEVYELYLRARQIGRSGNWQRKLELLEEAVRIDPNCAIAWEAIAVANINWTVGGFSKAGAAARRALELNDSLAGAWAVLAEIAEHEKRWNDSEELFLRALYIDPTHALVNTFYGEALLARGRVREALHYTLEGYRYDPAHWWISFHVAMIARYLGDAEVAIEYARITKDLRPDRYEDSATWDLLAEAYLIRGDVDQALSTWGEHGDIVADWFPQCVRSRQQPELRQGLKAEMQNTLSRYRNGDLPEAEGLHSWNVIRCGTWVGEADIVVDLIANNEELPAEMQFILFFQADSGVLRQTQFFRDNVVESGLLDYWREWGWSDYCRPDGDSFVCD